MKPVRLEDAFAPTPAAFSARVDETLHKIKEMQTMKRKTRLRLVLAAAIVLLLAFTTVAFATGALQSIFKSMAGIWREETVDFEALDELAREDVYDAELSFAAAEEPLRVEVTQSYYDGEQLMLGIRLYAPQTPVDLDFGPDDPAFQTLNGAQGGLESLSEEARAAFEERYRQTGRAGASQYSFYLGDGIQLADGTELAYKANADDEARPGQATDYYYVSDSPLPEAARDREAVEVVVNAYCARVCHYRDESGEYAAYGEREQQPLRFTITRSAEAAERRGAARQFADYAVEATLTATPVSTQVAVRLDSFEKWDESWEGQEGSIYNYQLLADGTPLNGELVGWREGDVHNGVYAPLPAGTKTAVLRPLYRQKDEQGQWTQVAVPGEDIVFDLTAAAPPAPSPQPARPTEAPYALPVAEEDLIERAQETLIELGLATEAELIDVEWRASLGGDVNYEDPTPSVLGEARRAGESADQVPATFFACVTFTPDARKPYRAEAVTVGPGQDNGNAAFGDVRDEESYARWEARIQEERWVPIAEEWLRGHLIGEETRLNHLKNKSGGGNVFGYQTHFVCVRFEDENGEIHDVTINPDGDGVVGYDWYKNRKAAW